MRFHLALALFSTTCLSAASAFAQAPANGPVTRDQIPALVRETLLNQPEILKEAIAKLQEKEEAEARAKSKEAVIKNKDAILNTDAPSMGDASADVTVVEFFDYHCGYCKTLLPAISRLLSEDKKVRVIFKEYPVLSEDSVTASRAALAVNRIAKDKYFAFHSELMEHKDRFDEKAIMAIAKKVGVDGTKLKAEMAKPEIAAALDKNRELGEALALRGTPAIIIGDELLPGAVPYEVLKKTVDAARAAKPAAAAPAAPTPPAAVPTPAAPPAPAKP